MTGLPKQREFDAQGFNVIQGNVHASYQWHTVAKVLNLLGALITEWVLLFVTAIWA